MSMDDRPGQSPTTGPGPAHPFGPQRRRRARGLTSWRGDRRSPARDPGEEQIIVSPARSSSGQVATWAPALAHRGV